MLVLICKLPDFAIAPYAILQPQIHIPDSEGNALIAFDLAVRTKTPSPRIAQLCAAGCTYKPSEEGSSLGRRRGEPACRSRC